MVPVRPGAKKEGAGSQLETRTVGEGARSRNCVGRFCLRSWSPVGPGRRWLLFTLQPRGPVLGGRRRQELRDPKSPGTEAGAVRSLEPDP